jgi:hypothetical protein
MLMYFLFTCVLIRILIITQSGILIQFISVVSTNRVLQNQFSISTYLGLPTLSGNSLCTKILLNVEQIIWVLQL